MEALEFSEFGLKATEFIFKPLEDHKKITILSGSIRSGKTVAMIPKLLEFLEWNYKGLKVIIGVTKETVYDNILSEDNHGLFSVLGKENYKYNITRGILKIRLSSGRWTTIKVLGAKDTASFKYLRGKTLAGAYVDEGSLIPRNFFMELLGRCSMKNSRIFVTTNPDSPYHWLYEEFICNNSDVETWNFILTENPALDPEYIEFISNQYSGVLYDRMILGKWVIASGLVYCMYDPYKHLIENEEVEEMLRNKVFSDFIAGVDWGFTNPMAVNIYGVITQNGITEYVQIDEFYETGKLTEDAAKYVTDWERKLGCSIEPIYCDPAEPDRKKEFRRRGLWAISGNNAIQDGINSVNTVLKHDRMKINKKCKNTLKEITTLKYPDEEHGKEVSEKPQKGQNDHSMSGKRYAIHTHEKKRAA